MTRSTLADRVAALEAGDQARAASPGAIYIAVQTGEPGPQSEPTRWTCGAWRCGRLPGESLDDFGARTLHEYRAAHPDAIAVPIFTTTPHACGEG